MEDSMEVPQKLKTGLHIQPNNSTFGYISKGMKLLPQKLSSHPCSLKHYSYSQGMETTLAAR